jgi:hypothetical protein
MSGYYTSREERNEKGGDEQCCSEAPRHNHSRSSFDSILVTGFRIAVGESEGSQSFYFDLVHMKCKSHLSSSFELLITVWFFYDLPKSNLVLFVSDDGLVIVGKKVSFKKSYFFVILLTPLLGLYLP